MSEASKMKLFLWEDVLHDYTAGMAVAYAESLEQALAMFPDYIATSLGRPSRVVDPEKDKEAFTAYVYGGG